MVDELLPRARHQTATRETNTCHTRPRLCKWKKQKENQKRNKQATKKTLKNHIIKTCSATPKIQRKTFDKLKMHVAEQLCHTWHANAATYVGFTAPIQNWGMSNFKGWSVFHGRGPT
jgi:hypothetical protein